MTKKISLADMPQDSAAFSEKHNVVLYKLPKGMVFGHDLHTFGSYPDPYPMTCMFSYSPEQSITEVSDDE